MSNRLPRAWGARVLQLATATGLLGTLAAAAGSMAPATPPPVTQMAPAPAPTGDGGRNAAHQLVEYRQAVMIIMRSNFAPLGAMAAGKIPFNAAAAQLLADRVAWLAVMVPEGFADSTKDEKSRARPQLWTNHAGFDGRAKDLVTRAQALAQLLKSDPTQSDSFLHSVEAVDHACDDCHDDFRSR